MGLEGKRIVITGANRGLGRALAIACLRAGAGEVVAGARARASLQGLRKEGARLTAVQLDVTIESDIERVAALGRADVLINNAGVIARGGALRASLDALEREARVNYFGYLRMARAFAPAMMAHGSGLIVNVASMLGKVSLPMIGTYCALKAATLSLGAALRGELAPRGVRVLTVCPCAIDTELSRGLEMPKISPAEAAREIVAAMNGDQDEVPIGDAARQVFAEAARDPQALQRAFDGRHG